MVSQGPHVLSEGETSISADVIFVHGFRGDAFDTWTNGKVLWPKELLASDLKEARIITWGYDSGIANLKDFSSQNSIFSHAENLLGDIAMKRRSNEERKRPIIFVGHSLGGLVIKEALIRSSEYLNNQQDMALGAIYSCTAGVVFLGTPHRGSNKTGLAEIVSGIARVALRRPNDKLARNLAEDSEVLERQRKSFASISEKMSLVCLYEEKPTDVGLIVPERSACIDGFRVKTGSIPANHMDLCKYATKSDIGYQRTSWHIISLVGNTGQNSEPDLSLLHPALEPDRSTLYRHFRASLPKELLSRDDSHAQQASLAGEIMAWRYHRQGPWQYWLPAYLQEGHSVNIRDFDGKTPLHHAVETKFESASKVRALVDAGADLCMLDYEGQTPVDVARERDEGVFVFLLRSWKRAVLAK